QDVGPITKELGAMNAVDLSIDFDHLTRSPAMTRLDGGQATGLSAPAPHWQPPVLGDHSAEPLGSLTDARLDGTLSLLDSLFSEAESLLGVPARRTLSNKDEVRLDALIGDIDDLLESLDADLSQDSVRLHQPPMPVALPLAAATIPATNEDPLLVLLPRDDGPLSLDQENALDQITAQLDLGAAMDLSATEVLTPSPCPRLTLEEARRVEALLNFMEHIIGDSVNTGGVLTPNADEQLTRLMSEADRLLGYDSASLSPVLANRANASASTKTDLNGWRHSVRALGNRVQDMIPGLGMTANATKTA
ncbi:MAG: hypothetical protein ACPGYL_15590, partial [Rhodospirillaceae bacterium]